MNTVLSVKDLCKTYIVKSNSNNVLRNVNFSMEQGEFISVMGPSGSGKSTLLYTVSGMDTATAGTVEFCGKDFSKLKRKELSELRLKGMGFVFQQMYLMKKLGIMDNILLPGFRSGTDRSIIKKRAEELMRKLGIIDIADNEINEVSGGQLQRACLCRALINEPKIIFADEPTGALNSRAASDVMRELAEINRGGTSILMVTHGVRAACYSDKVIYLVDGAIKGELAFGKFTSEDEPPKRERMLNSWLMEQGW